MAEQQIIFQVGDQVIHWIHGPGVILQLDEKSLSGSSKLYYEVKMSNLTLWVPVDQTGDSSLRLITPEQDFEDLFTILASPGEPLPSNHIERKVQLGERLKDHELTSICMVIRDLNMHRRRNRMSQSDNTTLKQSRRVVINEWSIASSIPHWQAESDLRKLLEGDGVISRR